MYFHFRLVPPRPTFAMTLTAEERAAMEAHGAYWRGLMAEGHVVFFGLVGFEGGPYGVGIAEFDDAEAAMRTADADPAIQANVGLRYEVSPMLFATVRE